jgi:membrane protein
MEDKKLNQEESIELITQMITNSKRRLEVGSGNTFLVWGYVTAAVSLAVYLLVAYTGSYIWCWGWFSIPVFGWLFILSKEQWKQRTVITYTDKVIDAIWMVLGIMFFGAVMVLMFTNAMNVMLPLSLILCAVGTSFTGIVLRERFLIFSPVIGFITGMIMLGILMNDSHSINKNWFLIFGACFVITMVIPGHLLNRKARKENV